MKQGEKMFLYCVHLKQIKEENVSMIYETHQLSDCKTIQNLRNLNHSLQIVISISLEYRIAEYMSQF